MQLFQEPKTFSQIFIAFLESTINFEHFQKKQTNMSLIAHVVSKLLTPRDELT